MRTRSLAALTLAIVVVGIPALAKAPPDQYEQYVGETATIKDAHTKLEWARNRVSQGTYAVAQAYCGGHPDLPAARLPTIKELQTIIDEQPHASYEFGKNVQKMFDEAAFPTMPLDKTYWTQTPAPNGQVWTLDFGTGEMKPLDPSNAASVANVRCVR